MSGGSRSQTDLTFFTNDPASGVSLYDRFNNFLTDTLFFILSVFRITIWPEHFISSVENTE